MSSEIVEDDFGGNATVLDEVELVEYSRRRIPSGSPVLFYLWALYTIARKQGYAAKAVATACGMRSRVRDLIGAIDSLLPQKERRMRQAAAQLNIPWAAVVAKADELLYSGQLPHYRREVTIDLNSILRELAKEARSSGANL